MPRLDLKTCRCCGGHSSKVGTLSWSRLCIECGLRNLAANVDGLTQIGSPEWRRWRNAMAATFGGPPLDELPRSMQSDAHGT